MSKVLIIGASGFLGKELYNEFKLDNNYDTFGTYCKRKKSSLMYLDITNLKNVDEIFKLTKPQIVIITAALTNVEYCEAHKDEALKMNVEGVKNICVVCKKYGCKVVYISTEYVFDGKSGPYTESDSTLPINYYGETKLKGENVIRHEIEDFLIVRTTVIYGLDVESKNFIMQLINNFKNNKPMKVPNDQFSSPTYCKNLSNMIKECCDKNINGILNLVGNQVMDRYTFALKAAEVLGLDKKLIIPIDTASLGQVAKRPLNAGLIVDKVSSVLENKPMNINSGLNDVKKYYLKYLNEEVK